MESNIFWQKFKKNKLACLSLFIIIFVVLMSILAPFYTKYEPSDIDLNYIRQGPSKEHILGADDLGRDIFTRLAYGGRVSIAVALSSMLVQILIGVTLGSIAGFFGGKIDRLITMLIDTIMCFPFFVIAVALSMVLGGSVKSLIIIIGVLTWPGVARIVRGEVLTLKEDDYILAAHALGLSKSEILISHVLPNIMSPILVSSTLSIANGILSEASLSFLGLGVQPPEPSWGNMLVGAQNMDILKNQWWQWMPAGFMVLIVVLSINFLGDALRDAFDPKYKVGG